MGVLLAGAADALPDGAAITAQALDGNASAASQPCDTACQQQLASPPAAVAVAAYGIRSRVKRLWIRVLEGKRGSAATVSSTALRGMQPLRPSTATQVQVNTGLVAGNDTLAMNLAASLAANAAMQLETVQLREQLAAALLQLAAATH